MFPSTPTPGFVPNFLRLTLRALLGLAALVFTQTQPAAGQRLYRVEASAAGTYSSFGKATELSSSAGGVARFGYWLTQRFTFELTGGFSVPKADNGNTVNVLSLSGSLLVNFPVSLHSSLYLTLGYASVTYDKATCPPVSVLGDGPCGRSGSILSGAGARFAISPTMMLRSELLLDRNSSPSFSNVHFGTGLSIMFGSKHLTDADQDRVYDRFDRCADTPAGAIVDKHGCPGDYDKDGVFDGLDRCPNTPPGAAVDRLGCPADADRDAVLDGIDQCKDTPLGAVVDPTGCPRDTDGDKVFDGLDRCPNTPAGATVDRLGCPGDQDNDRVFDGIDRCPDTPPGVAVNAFGCPPNQDTDRDGVTDPVDACPNTPAGAPVDSIGCPVAVPVPDSTQPPAPDTSFVPSQGPWVIPGSAFDYRSAELKPEAYPALDSVARSLAAQPRLQVEIGGFAHDQLGTAGNQRLSLERAMAVRTYLLTRGVRDAQIRYQGYGSTRLLTQATTPEARMRNRRVEVRVIGELEN